MTKLPNLVKGIDMQARKHSESQTRWMRRGPLQDIRIKMPKVKDKERILKAVRERKSVTYRGVPIRLSADFSKETLQTRRVWQEIFKAMKARTYSQHFSSQQRYHLELKGR